MTALWTKWHVCWFPRPKEDVWVGQVWLWALLQCPPLFPGHWAPCSSWHGLPWGPYSVEMCSVLTQSHLVIPASDSTKACGPWPTHRWEFTLWSPSLRKGSCLQEGPASLGTQISQRGQCKGERPSQEALTFLFPEKTTRWLLGD